MDRKPTYDELESKVRELEKELRDAKRAEKMLPEAETLKQLLGVAPFGVFLIDLSGKIVTCSENGAERLGRTTETAIGTALRDYFPPAVSENRRLRGMEAIHSRNAITFEDQVEGKWYRNSIVPFFDKKGMPVRLAIFGADVTEYRHAVDALKKSEETYRQLAELLPQVVLEMDEKGNITYANRMATDLFGYTRADFEKGINALQMLIPEDREPALANMQKALMGEKSGGSAYTVLTKSGRTYPVMLYSNAIMREGEPVGIRGIMADLTQIKQAQEALRESEERYRRIYENSVVGFFQSTPEGRFLHVNPALAKMLRYESPEDLVSSIDDIASTTYANPTDRRRYHEALKANGHVEDFQFKARCKDGSEVWISDSSRAYFDEDGEATCYEGIVVDITERRRAEEALRESEARLRTIFNTSSDAILVFSAEGALVLTNPAAARMYGYHEEEMIGLTGRDIVHPDYRHLFRAFIRECTETGHFQTESMDVRKDGSLFNVEVHGSLFEYRGVQHLLAMVRDITARKEMETALRKSEAKYRDIYDNAQAAIFRTRLSDGKVLECNDRFAKTYGFESREECMADYVLEKHYVDPGAREHMLAQLVGSGEVNDFEARFFRKDGSIVFTRFSARAYPEEGFLEGVGYDVTREKKALEELRISEEKYRNILESMKEGYYEVDIAGNLTFFNESLCEILGYREDELTGLNYRAYTTEENSRRVYDTFNRVYVTGVPAKEFDWEIVRKDSTKRFIEVSVSPRKDAEGAVIGFSGIVRDVTEKRMLESQLQRAQKMEALGLLAGGVAHDLNNILSGIVSYPELILMDLPKDSPLRKPMKTIHESGMRAAGVVSDLLTIARGVATGKETLDLNTIVTEYMDSAEFQNLVRTNTLVHFRSELDPHLLNMNGSPIHLKKTLMNLVTNASEAIEGGGTVTISTFNRYLDEPLKGYDDVRTGEYVVLSVSDNGRGISSRDMERIFEPFYTKKVMGRSGTGLGLAVVWNTVQDHTGYIHVDTSNKATTFELYFPVTRKEIAAAKETFDLKTCMGHGEKILVVDDEESQREIAKAILTKLGYHADAVSSGEEAIDYVKENPVDLIVLDMVMPKGINGRETYQEIIGVRPGQKAIIASGYAQTEEVDAAQKLGAGRYIRKPYILEKIGIAAKEELEK